MIFAVFTASGGLGKFTGGGKARAKKNSAASDEAGGVGWRWTAKDRYKRRITIHSEIHSLRELFIHAGT